MKRPIFPLAKKKYPKKKRTSQEVLRDWLTKYLYEYFPIDEWEYYDIYGNKAGIWKHFRGEQGSTIVYDSKRNNSNVCGSTRV